MGPLRCAAAAMNTTVVNTASNGDCAFDTMAYWTGGARDLGTWKLLRQQISQYILDHLHDGHWQTTFESCGEYDPPEAGNRSEAVKSRAGSAVGAAASSAPAGGIGVQEAPIRPGVLDAVCWVVVWERRSDMLRRDWRDTWTILSRRW